MALKSAATQLQFASAGLKDKHVGDSADPRSVAACATRGYDLSLHRCREISADDFRSHDLILAMDRDNLQQLRARAPADATAMIELFIVGGEVPDPYFGGDEGFSAMLKQIEAGVTALLARVS
jgi:protein-tyrosine phosphatase